MTGSVASRLRRGSALIAATGLLSAAGAGVANPVAFGAAGGVAGYSAVAVAEGLRNFVHAADAPATSAPFDGGANIAQAVTDSLGASKAYASNPYPGDLAVTGPGVVAGFTNGEVNLPNYPFYVRADHPTSPEQSAGADAFQMRASAAADHAEAASSTGSSGKDTALGSSLAKAETGLDEGRPFSSAETSVDSFRVGPLTLGSVRSSSHVVLAPDGALLRRSSLEVSAVSLAGVPVQLTPDGMATGPVATSLPETGLKALADAGITIRFLEATDIDDGLVSEGLEVVVARPTPGPVTAVRTTYLLGRSVVRVGTQGDHGVDGSGTPVASGADSAPDGAGAGVPAVAGASGPGETAVSGRSGAEPAPGGAAPPLWAAPARVASQDSGGQVGLSGAPPSEALAAGRRPGDPSAPVAPEIASLLSVSPPARGTLAVREIFPVALLAALGAVVAAWRFRPRPEITESSR